MYGVIGGSVNYFNTVCDLTTEFSFRRELKLLRQLENENQSEESREIHVWRFRITTSRSLYSVSGKGKDRVIRQRSNGVSTDIEVIRDVVSEGFNIEIMCEEKVRKSLYRTSLDLHTGGVLEQEM